MKRKTDQRASLGAGDQPESKKRALSNEEAITRFNDGLFDPSLQQKYTEEYAQSAPYVSWCIYKQLDADQCINTVTSMASCAH